MTGRVVVPQPPVTEDEAAEFRNRVRAAYVGTAKPHQAPAQDGDAAPAAPTILRYEALRMPRGNIVVEQPSKRVEAQFGSFQEAEVHADQLNKWLAARPASDRRYKLYVVPPEPTEAGLVALIDRIYEPEAVPLEMLKSTAAANGKDAA